ncbi:thiamine pyrophosphokinase [Orbaceae bacterium ESL0727]|nr:thiamine pyrophosphokinase [Orbaceae bacterium ESL0727]
MKNQNNSEKVASDQTALLFLNGEPPHHYPSATVHYHYIACTDGAYHNYLCNTLIAPDFIIGDLDSFDHSRPIPSHSQLIHTPDQNKTDFEKAILFLASRGITDFVVYGASGHASDHFLGNLSVAMHYSHIDSSHIDDFHINSAHIDCSQHSKKYTFTFYDDYGYYFLVNQHAIISQVKDKTISLLPLSPVSHLTLEGFKYPLTDANLQLGQLVSLRNHALTDTVKITFDTGDLLVFIASETPQN